MRYSYKIIDIVFECTFPIQLLDEKYKGNNKNKMFRISSFERKEETPLFQLYEIPEKQKLILQYRETFILHDQEMREIISNSVSGEGFEILFLHIFRYHAIQHHIVQFHSSLIRYYDKGLMFLGPSGIGKTTQAELWNKYRDALIINGDIVFVQETPDAFLGWGTPWHGSSPYCENTSVPLKAMIVLKQSPENSIRELTGFEKVTAVSNNVFYPTWLENGMELCLETLDHLLSRIPVYELSCCPDEEAVKLTEETIFGSGSVSD